MGGIISLGVLAYVIGKFLLAGIADFLGGKRNFLAGMAGAIVFTLLFALGGGLPFFTLAWIGNRFVQAAGWGGLVKIASRWFSYSSYGTVLGVLSLSFLFGDAAARQFMGWLIRRGVGWHGIFFAAAGTLFVLFLLNIVFLKESRAALGYSEPEVNPLNLFADAGGSTKPDSVLDLLRRFGKSPVFWLVAAISLGATLVRETFNTWTPMYLTQTGYSQADAASFSALFPFFGGVSVLLAGYLSDRLGPAGRAVVMSVGLTLAGAALLVLHGLPLVSIVALGLLGPYSYLAGAMALDLGGSKGGASASGLIDGIGYLAGILAGDSIARISVSFGWPAVFRLLGVVSLLSAGAAILLVRKQRNR